MLRLCTTVNTTATNKHVSKHSSKQESTLMYLLLSCRSSYEAEG